MSICGDEHQHPGRRAVARDPGRSRQSWLICCVYLHAKDLRIMGRESCHWTGHVDSVRLGFFGDARILARAIRGRARRELLQSLCPRARRGTVSVCLASRLGHCRCAVLLSIVGRCNRRAGGDPYYLAIPVAGDWFDCLADPPARSDTAISNVALSGSRVSRIRRIFVRTHLAHELTHPDSLRRVDPDQRRGYLSCACLASQGVAI